MSNLYSVDHYFRFESEPGNRRPDSILGGTEAVEAIDAAYCEALAYELGNEIRIHGPPYFRLRTIGSRVLLASRSPIEVVSLAPLADISERISREILESIGPEVSISGTAFLYSESRLRDRSL